jgi:hypothetical protein
LIKTQGLVHGKDFRPIEGKFIFRIEKKNKQIE